MTITDQAEGAARASETTAAPLGRGLGWLYLIGGAIGFLASIALILEKIATLTGSGYVPTCSFNPVFSCGSVMDSRRLRHLASPTRS